METTDVNRSEAIGIAGNGRVAQALGKFLSEQGQPVVAIAGRNPKRTARAARFVGSRARPTEIQDLPSVASNILIAVSDGGVELVAQILAHSGFRRGIALHTCGVKGPEALEVLARQGVSCGALHPLQSFATTEQGIASLPGSVVAVDGDPEALRWASSIVSLLSGRIIRVRPEYRAIYHAAAVMASNYVTAVIYAAVELLQAAGVERSTGLSSLAPIVRASVENSFSLGPVNALTGPIQRANCHTVAAHLKGLEHSPHSVRDLYCAAGRVVVQMAVERGLPQPTVAKFHEMLRLQE